MNVKFCATVVGGAAGSGVAVGAVVGSGVGGTGVLVALTGVAVGAGMGVGASAAGSLLLVQLVAARVNTITAAARRWVRGIKRSFKCWVMFWGRCAPRASVRVQRLSCGQMPSSQDDLVPFYRIAVTLTSRYPPPF